MRGAQYLAGFSERDLSLPKLGKIDSGFGIGRNSDRKREPIIIVPLPPGRDEALDGRNCALGEAQSASFGPHVECGKAAAGGLNSEYVFLKEVAGVGRPGVVRLIALDKLETLPTGFVRLQHGTIAGQVAYGESPCARVQEPAV